MDDCEYLLFDRISTYRWNSYAIEKFIPTCLCHCGGREHRHIESFRGSGINWFSYIHRLLGGGLELDGALIISLVERWRPETHTFHLTPALVYELLGVRPENPEDPIEPKIITRSLLKLIWLKEHFSVLEDDADDVTVERHARAYILYLFGCILFPDKSGDSVQLIYLPLLGDLERVDEYSWGSATFAYLYHNLCQASRKGAKVIGGCL
ncbi:serine/threonine-protein phosphatase 7 long form homolog [Amaranthus tricolor]|uniref:serine/threonine-protein phosphatase 7 long form homolog n=1 Tax=Amaranthus tricolor TaxID=29722 RepID=UPI00258E19F2|nr:serine/threonine-protein phosphatase 7 long form homolog [Amaranthus tricolor]